MAAYFITATGTDTGKTFVTTALCKQLRAEGKQVFAVKPVITGWTEDKETNDTLRILESLSLEADEVHIQAVSPWRFKAPLAANLAAHKEGKVIDFDKVVKFCLATIQRNDEYIFIEGAGGVMSPLTDNKTFLDLIKAVNIPVILVCGSYLGSISHTLTAMETLAAYHKVKVKHVIVSESEGSNTTLGETSEILRRFLGRKVTGLPRLHKEPTVLDWEAVLQD